MSVINTNVLSLTTQNNLNKSQSSLGTAIERLSSGLRINSAKDDAAGQAIANRFTANIKGLSQASRNANDGISMAQTTEGALNEINNNLQRVRELAVQASNGTNSTSDLDSIQAEISSRLDEIDRVSAQTQFNGTKVLAKDSTMVIQVGANDNETIALNLKEIDTSTLGLKGFSVQKATALTATDVTNTLTGAPKPGLADVNLDTSSLIADAKTALSEAGATSDNKVYKSDAGDYFVNITGTAGATKDGYYKVTINDAASDTSPGKVNFGTGTLINAVKPATTVTPGQIAAVADRENVPPTYKLDSADATTTAIPGGKVVSLKDSKGVSAGFGIQDSNGKLYAADVTNGVAKVKSITFTDANATSQTQAVELGGADGKTEVVTSGGKIYKSADLTGKNVITDNVPEVVDAATPDPMTAIDKALAMVDDLRSNLGAIQNRFDSAITNLGNTVTNMTAARSRIEDADYATEVSNMSRAQILQQAGTSVLSQANQVPQTVLSLLR